MSRNLCRLLLLLSCAACTTTDLIVERRGAYVNYVVHNDGETLVMVARRFTGSPANWRALSRYNPKLDPFHLEKGDVVHIPREWTVEEDISAPSPRLEPPAEEPAPPAAPGEDYQLSPTPTPAEQPPAPPRPETPGPAITQPTPTPPAGDKDDEQRRHLRNKLLDEILHE